MLRKLFERITEVYNTDMRDDAVIYEACDKKLVVLFDLFEDELKACGIKYDDTLMDAHILNFENLGDYLNDIMIR